MSSTTELKEKSDDQLQIALDNALADYYLANKYESNEASIPGIRKRMHEVTAEMERRGLRYSHDKANKARAALTHKQNMEDMVAKGRGISPTKLKTHCKHGHPFNEENTGATYRLGRSGPGRYCKACRRNHDARTGT